MGGMHGLQAAASYPDRVFSALPVATAARHTAQNIAFHEVGRQALMADPDWRNGEYTRHGVKPERGPAVARMAAWRVSAASSDEHTSELQSLMRISFAVFCFTTKYNNMFATIFINIYFTLTFDLFII